MPWSLYLAICARIQPACHGTNMKRTPCRVYICRIHLHNKETSVFRTPFPLCKNPLPIYFKGPFTHCKHGRPAERRDSWKHTPSPRLSDSPTPSPRLSRRTQEEVIAENDTSSGEDPENYPLHSPWSFWFDKWVWYCMMWFLQDHLGSSGPREVEMQVTSLPA